MINVHFVVIYSLLIIILLLLINRYSKEEHMTESTEKTEEEKTVDADSVTLEVLQNIANVYNTDNLQAKNITATGKITGAEMVVNGKDVNTLITDANKAITTANTSISNLSSSINTLKSQMWGGPVTMYYRSGSSSTSRSASGVGMVALSSSYCLLNLEVDFNVYTSGYIYITSFSINGSSYYPVTENYSQGFGILSWKKSNSGYHYKAGTKYINLQCCSNPKSYVPSVGGDDNVNWASCSTGSHKLCLMSVYLKK